MHMFSDGDYYIGGMHGLWWFVWIVLIGVLIFSGWGRSGDRRREPGETPHEVLKRRLANGDISAEEYEQRKLLLDRDADTKVSDSPKNH